MKIVVSAIAPDLDSVVEPRFGRAAYFVVVDMDTLEWESHPNPAAAASGGAGTQAAQYIANQGAQTAISGDFGPNACNALNAVAVAMYLLGSSHTVREAVEEYKNGKLAQVSAPTSAGHSRR